MSKKFQKKVEDFTCENCGFFVTGDGYTNHCPKCLWGKHVDVNPGDRAENCGGMMKPISVIKKNGGFSVVHQCQKCGFERLNKTNPSDEIGNFLDSLGKD